MPYIDPFISIVTATKRNNRYRGPTESHKISSFLGETQTDLNTIYNEISNIRTKLDILASGYVESEVYGDYLQYLKGKTYNLEGRMNSRIDVQASQDPVY